ncbi:MAG: hypothetical protein QOK31_900 [Solirubrobacteraceae bacterium]|nr:hypothetical protein [Solirubrobacteraceae bacterium]
MADVQPLHALHYDLAGAGALPDLVSPPYDVIDSEHRARLVARSPHNVVQIDLPQGEDAYAEAARLLQEWRTEGVVVRDEQPAIWALTQDYTGPDGRAMTRHGFLCRVRVEDYGPGRIRPHERTHPGPKEDRLRLTRATRANLSPIFSLFSDPGGAAWGALAPHTEAAPWGEVTDSDGTTHRVWRVTDGEAIAAVQDAAGPAELLIADGHHRYETARVYAEEVGAGDGPHRYVLMCLVALEDPGLTVFPTHRLVRGLTSEQQEALAAAIRRDWEIEPIDEAELEPPPGDDSAPVRIGYMDSHFLRAFRLTLKDPAIAARALPDRSEAYRRLDTAVTEALLVKGALDLSDDDIDHLHGFGYARDTEQARALIREGTYDAGFFMGATPVERVQAVAAAGESMPPKSTYFFPKILTGLVFNPLA